MMNYEEKLEEIGRGMRNMYRFAEARECGNGITDITLWTDEKRRDDWMVHILLTPHRAFYSRDCDSEIFEFGRGGEITDTRDFFRRDGVDSHIDPRYWAGKVSAVGRHSSLLDNSNLDVERIKSALKEAVNDFYRNERVDSYKQERLNEAWKNLDEAYPENAEASRHLTFEVLKANNFLVAAGFEKDEGTYEIAKEAVSGSRGFSREYLTACCIMQYVANNLDRWISETREREKDNSLKPEQSVEKEESFSY